MEKKKQSLDLTIRAQPNGKAVSETGEVEGFASVKTVDRHGHLVLPSAFATTVETFMANPIFCLGHDSSGQGGAPGLPIGSVTQLRIQDDGVRFKAAFAGTPMAQMVRQLYTEGHMRAFSIGFWIKDQGYREPTADEVRQYGPELRMVITGIELAEISAVPLPSCREALALAVRSFGPPQVGAAEPAELRAFLGACLKAMPGGPFTPPVPAPAKTAKAWTADQKAAGARLSAAFVALADSHGAIGEKVASLERCPESDEDPMPWIVSLSELSAVHQVKGADFEAALHSLKASLGKAAPAASPKDSPAPALGPEAAAGFRGALVQTRSAF